MALLLVLLFIVVPIVELAVIIQVGQWLGVVPTVALLLIDSLVGAWLLRREGRSAWRRFRSALDQTRMPAVEVVDGALVIFGGALLLTPGFITDIVGILLLIPPTRAIINRMIRSRVRVFFLSPSTSRYGRRNRVPGTPGRDDVLDVEVIKVERDVSSRP